MRVLMNALNAGNRSGTGRYITELAKAFLSMKSNDDYYFVWPDNLAAPLPDCEKYLIRKSSSALPRLFYDHKGIDGLGQSMKADLVHYPTGIGPRLSKLPVVLTVHDLCFFHHPEWFSRSRALYYRCVMAAGIRRADCIIADSQATAEDIIRFMNIPAERIDVVPLGVDARFTPASTEEKKRVREQYNLPERFFLFVGTVEPRKNLARLVQAWSLIRDSAPPLVIVGRHGWGDAISFPPDIIRLDYAAQELLPALYSAATAFVWPSLMEGFGLPPLEAMACGTPVLSSNTSSLPEVVGDAAIQVDPLDTQAIADGMAALAEDADLRERLRKKGLERAAGFSWQSTAAKTRAVYEKVYAEC